MTMGRPPRAMTTMISISSDLTVLELELTLLIGIQRLSEDIVARKDHDDWKILINQGKNTMLEFSRHDCLAMEVGNFLDLKGTYSLELAHSSQC
jgi:hypothetical protein